jgi:eukaryotic-like serine/threonine-protein kinase
VAKVADAVSAAHSVGVLHKDIKLSNILIHVSGDGTMEPRLSDFGIGLLTDRSQLAGETSRNRDSRF